MDVLGKHMHDSVLSKLEKAYDSMVRQAASSEENDMSILFEPSLCPYIYIVMCTPFCPRLFLSAVLSILANIQAPCTSVF